MKKKESGEILVALAGQPNSGKSTIFNLLSGARQHVANYPGVTVERKIGAYSSNGNKVVVVDLPGTYSLTSYSQEERIARDFLLLEKPDVVVDVVDAANLERSLYLLFQLKEMGVPVILNLNMMDVAKRRGFEIDLDTLSRELDSPVVPTIGNKGKGKKELRETIQQTYADAGSHSTPLRLEYGEALERILTRLEGCLSSDPRLAEHFSGRWLAVKLMENDSEVQRLVRQYSERGEDILSEVERDRDEFRSQHGRSAEKVIGEERYRAAELIVGKCVTERRKGLGTLSDSIDRVVLHRFLGPIILALVLFLFYQIVMSPDYGGQKLAGLCSPIWTAIHDFADTLFAAQELLRDGPLRSLFLYSLVDGILAICNYLPIFVVLFIMVAILEDTGYMARIAFLLDRLLKWFGLHGQSTLPMLIAGAILGGCAVVGTNATRAMKDEKARMVTILIMPLMNCLAKGGFYVLIIGMFFKEHAGAVLFGLSVGIFIIALMVAKILSLFVVRGEAAPFVMELPAYHLPTIRGVLRRACERLWLLIKKIATIVVAIAIVVWFFIFFPGLSDQKEAGYDRQLNEAKFAFVEAIGRANPYARFVAGESDLMALGACVQEYKKAKRSVGDNEKLMEKLSWKYLRRNPEFFKIAQKGKSKMESAKLEEFKKYLADYRQAEKVYLAQYQRLGADDRASLKRDFYQAWQDANPLFFAFARTGKVEVKGADIVDLDARKVEKAYQKLNRTVKALKRDRKQTRIYGSMAGRFGRALEPVTLLAGFPWRINIALISSFAAKENLVATLGTLYSIEGETGGSAAGLSASMKRAEGGWTRLHALTILIFVALFPPCIPTMIMIRAHSNTKWMLFAAVYPIVLGLTIAVVVFQGGRLLGL